MCDGSDHGFGTQPDGGHAGCDVSRTPGNVVPCSDFFADDAALLKAFEYQRSFCPDADTKASATFMLSDYIAVLMNVLIPLTMHHRIVPSLAPRDVGLSFHQATDQPADPSQPQPRTMRVVFLSSDLAAASDLSAIPTREGATKPDLAEALRTETERHFAPLISRLSALSGLAPAAFWRLVADGIAAEFLTVGKNTGEEALAKALALRIVKTQGSPLNNAQLHFFDLDLAVAGEPSNRVCLRARGGCCRYYTVEAGRFCTTCVLKAPAPRNRDLRIALRRRFGLSD